MSCCNTTNFGVALCSDSHFAFPPLTLSTFMEQGALKIILWRSVVTFILCKSPVVKDMDVNKTTGQF